jgi:hypothetical protein
VFVVDSDIRIQWLNPAAAETFRLDAAAVLEVRSGEALECVNAANGCGKSPACVNCAIRNSVTASLHGRAVTRRRMRATLLSGEILKDVDLLITASTLPGDARLALLTLEDISELSTLRQLIPICAKCKRIRNDQQYWQSVETYFHDHLGAEFTHGLCGGCMKDLYPEMRLDS